MLRRYTEAEFVQRFLQRDRGLTWDISVETRVSEILRSVREDGDAVVCEYAGMFDGVSDLRERGLAVDPDAIARGPEQIPGDLIEAMRLAIANLRSFHRREVYGSWWDTREDGSIVGQKVLPMKRAGIYVPGGRAAYPSSLLMGAVPAQVAGVEELVVCSPPGPDGEVNPLILAAAALLGVEKVFRIGGAQAIAAMAFGTETVPAADIICGPGNIYVTEAKRLVYGVVEIDSLAGPSELAVIADDSADSCTVAADLVAQAEHDPEAGVFLFTGDADLFAEVSAEVENQAKNTEREEIARAALENESAAVVGPEDHLWELINRQAPEHLSIRMRDSAEKLTKVRNVGAVFIGPLTAVAFGDYTAGVNHVLPTAGTARFGSALGVESFLKRTNILHMSKEGFAQLAHPTELFARAEGLAAHADSIAIRRDEEC